MTSRRLVLFSLSLLLCCGLNGCSEAPNPNVGIPSQASQRAAQPASRPSVSMTAPEGWQSKEPTQSFYLNMWDLPGGGTASVSWLGGSTEMVQANLDRWIGQMLVDGADAYDVAEIFHVDDSTMPLTIVVLPGTLASTTQVGGGEPRANWILLGAIVISPSGPIYVKALGPEAELGSQRDAFIQSVKDLKLL